MNSDLPLAERDCERLGRDAQPVHEDEIAELLPRIPGWDVMLRDGVVRLERVYRFANFAEALAFTNAVGAMAEAQDHHPALLTEWGKVSVGWWTHVVGGLHLNDFIAAAKTA